MRILFIGASSFGLKALNTILTIKEVEVVGIISNMPKFSISYNKKGVQNVLYVDFEETAKKENIPFYRMQNSMKEESLSGFIDKIGPDFGIVVGWYHMIPAQLLDKFPFAGLHASLLPDYSGGAPLVWAIINGEVKTGITFFLMDKGVDAGDIISQKETPIYEDDNIRTLYDRIEMLGLEIIVESLPKIANNTIVFKKQDESKRRIFPQRSPEDGKIDWTWDCKRITNFIRAQTKPYPGAFTIINDKKIIIWDATVEEL